MLRRHPPPLGPTLMRTLVVGPGYVGSLVCELLVEGGHEVRALRRSARPVPGDPEPLVADVTAPLSLPRPSVEAVVYTISPSDRSPDAYRAAYIDGPAHVLDWLGWSVDGDSGPCGRFLLVSSTGVYGADDGRRVDEDTPPRPSSPTGKVILEGERRLLDRHEGSVVLRLAGIYGPGRERTIERVRSGGMPCPEPGTWGNRIHRHDAAAAAVHLLELEAPESVYLGVDRDPADLRDVYRWLADRLGVEDPCAHPTRRGDDVPERRGTNKRCDGSRLVASGYSFRFSTFREGYGSLLGD